MIDIIVLILALIAAYFSTIKFVHIFQLNSYAHDTQKRWMKNNVRKLIPNVIISVFGIILYLIFSILGILPFILGMIFNRYKKAKKPIAYTARVKRLITTIIIVSIILPCIFAFINIHYAVIIAAIIYLINPLIVLIADTINSPIEKSVKNYYIRDAKRILASSNANVIGVTGSFGKTSVKYYLHSLLSSQFDTLMTPESFNTPMGVVITIRGKLNARHKHFICEMGARRVGDIKEICDIVHPSCAIITSVGTQHLETFGTIENVTNTKFELADSLPDGAPLFVNTDNKYIKQALQKYEKTRKIITYGSSQNADYRFETVSVNSRGTEFKIFANGESYTYTTRLIGEHNVQNITGAIAVSNTLGIPLAKLALPVKRLPSVPHRLELTDNGSAIIIDDAYNSNPSGAEAALKALSLFEEYKILVTPGMVELGDKQYECNRTFGKQAAEVADYIILVGKKQAEPILDGMGNFPKERYFVADTVNEAITHAYALNSGGKKKVILLENDLPDNYLG